MAAVELRRLVGTWATLELVGGGRTSGFVYAVDPENGSALLCTPLPESTPADGESVRVRPCVVFAHAVRSVVADAPATSAGLSDMHLTRRAELKGALPIALPAARLIKLRALLETHHIPYEAVAEGADGAAEPTLELFGSLRISPPYDSESCACENDLVLSRIQVLIRGIDVGREAGPEAAPRAAESETETIAVESAAERCR
jgi:hypothetical protein